METRTEEQPRATGLVQTATREMRPFDGWALHNCALLDVERPGFLRSMFAANAARRQAVFAFLAMRDVRDAEGAQKCIYDAATIRGERNAPAGDLPHVLLASHVRTVAMAAYGWLPEGLGATLCRIGRAPLKERQTYARLGELFFDGTKRHQAQVLRYQGQIDEELLERIETLHPALLHPKFRYDCFDREDVGELNAAVRILQTYCSHWDDAALARAVSSLERLRHLRPSMCEWLSKADRLPAPPVPGDIEIVPLRSGPEMEAAGREFENCLRTKIASVAAGHVYYYAKRTAPRGIASLHKLVSGDWMLGGVHAPANSYPEDDLVDVFKDRFRAWGVPYLARLDATPGWDECSDVFRYPTHIHAERLMADVLGLNG